MLLLSSLLGPAKPPVASREDVASAQGTCRVRRNADCIVAVENQGHGMIQISPGERCLVCLEEYQTEDELRQLNKCSHLFHRECIDEVFDPSFGLRKRSSTDSFFLQWLTTGRNSCPLCRGQGVDEKKGALPERTQSLSTGTLSVL